MLGAATGAPGTQGTAYCSCSAPTGRAMTEIVINLERGPDDHPVGKLRTGTGQIIPFTGWLHLIRVLEDQLLQVPTRPDASADDQPLIP